ncbi:SDR family NAD(P)-dependent oxidoreductase [Cryptosporangium aurantiacum]|uniref:Short chain dehydrogenase n=1 Tax=Cryptosporangium aurantiacum TaxID=134849 RepID=A0A1M7R365_9ACTN|nr:SDR family NAD(P)-dependent oxidoreductase [Cryptosporangium aurantiacum]SHN39284.1 short chain dehydrogenase [Cryptosporangium aurantiacum]
MPTLAIVGAGPGLGLSIAEIFGRNGFRVALISRNQEKLDGLAARLSEAGIGAAGFAADVLDRPSLTAALAAAAERFGTIDVLEYSPAPHTASPSLAMADVVDVVDVTPENLQPQLEYYLYGAVTAAKAVLPAMLAAGAGTLLFTTGAGSVTPIPPMGNVNAAAAALRRRRARRDRADLLGAVHPAAGSRAPLHSVTGRGPSGPRTAYAEKLALRAAWWKIATRARGPGSPPVLPPPGGDRGRYVAGERVDDPVSDGRPVVLAFSAGDRRAPDRRCRAHPAPVALAGVGIADHLHDVGQGTDDLVDLCSAQALTTADGG